MEITSPDPEQTAARNERMHRRRKVNIFRGLNSGTAILLALILVLMFNYLSSRHYRRFDWTTNQRHALSGQTVNLLSGLEAPVHAIVMMQPDHEIYHLFYDDLRQIMEEYRHASRGLFSIEAVDPDRNPARAAEIIKRHGIKDPNLVLIEQDGRTETITADEFADIDFAPVLSGGLPRKKSFKGEAVLSSAIFRLGNQTPARIYFLQGQGERDFDEHDPYTGLSRIASYIRNAHIELIPWRLTDQPGIPDDADALIVAAPTREFPAAAVERLRSYYNGSGRIMLMLDAETDAGLTPLLSDWGIRSMNSIVIDPQRTLSGYEVVVDEYQDHVITEQLAGLSTVFYWPRALPPDTSDGKRAAPNDAVILAQSSGASWAELDLQQRPPRLDRDYDLAGPIPVAVAIKSGRGQTGEMAIDPGRAVVFGDAEFVSNTGLTGANADLMLNALNWMLDRSDALAISPRTETGAELLIESRGLRRLFWLVVIALPLATGLTGFTVWWRRRT